MEPKEPLSYSRLGPMDPRQVRYELAAEVACSIPGTARRRRRFKLRKRVDGGGRE